MDKKTISLTLDMEEYKILRKVLLSYDASAKIILPRKDWAELRRKIVRIFDKALDGCYDDENVEALITDIPLPPEEE